MSIPPPDNTLLAIQKKVRRLTASASENSLTTADLNQYISTYYSNDFPYSIKIDQMRSVYTFFTTPYQDRYPLDVNFNQGVRAPMYVEGIQGSFYKDRQQFYNIWPRYPTLFNQNAVFGSPSTFSFTLTGPFLSREVVFGGTDNLGNPIIINDDGIGNLNYLTVNPVVSVPVATSNPAFPGMYNLNTLNPGLLNPTKIGTVNYITGVCAFVLPGGLTLAAGTQLTCWVSVYQPGRPYSLLFWNNEFHIRPIPKLIHKVEIETYLTPVQFLETSQSPILNQWWQIIAIGSALKVLEDRQDMDGVENMKELYARQQDLVLERQGVEELFQPMINLFNSTSVSTGFGGGLGGTSGYF